MPRKKPPPRLAFNDALEIVHKLAHRNAKTAEEREAVNQLHDFIVNDHADDTATVQRIVALMDGEEWDSECIGEVANVLTEAGYELREPQAYGGWDHDGGPDTQEQGTNGN